VKGEVLSFACEWKGVGLLGSLELHNRLWKGRFEEGGWGGGGLRVRWVAAGRGRLVGMGGGGDDPRPG